MRQPGLESWASNVLRAILLATALTTGIAFADSELDPAEAEPMPLGLAAAR